MEVAGLLIEHLTKVFPGEDGREVRAVSDLNLTVEEKELLVLLGPSGCGKTTTLRLIAGLETPDGGTIKIGGRKMDPVPPKELPRVVCRAARINITIATVIGAGVIVVEPFRDRTADEDDAGPIATGIRRLASL